MIIGFDQRHQTILENSSSLPFFIDVSTQRTSERNLTIVFRYQESSNTAIVETFTQQNNPEYDALFGTNQNPSDSSIREILILNSGDNTIPSLRTLIRNDNHPEEQECYTISIITADIRGVRRLFTCNEDESNPTDFFCDHTICIDDDDGQLPAYT